MSMLRADPSRAPAGAPAGAPVSATAFLVLDAESVPDGRLIARVRYPGESLSPEEAIARARDEARAAAGSDFLPVTFQIPVAVGVLRAGADFKLQALACLDAPHFRPRDIVKKFWQGVGTYSRARLVTFNGRGFDLPLLELAAFRYGCSCRAHFHDSRHGSGDRHLDLMDWLGNRGSCHLTGGLNLLAKVLGKPGKMAVTGAQVYDLYRAGKVREINDYCLHDTLDTYFVFLRTRVLSGDLTLEEEAGLVRHARDWLNLKAADLPGLRPYLDQWGDWEPWP